jgi:hypothetical protein
MTDFLQWNPNANNQETDAAYAADAQRSGGAADPSVFASTLANKAFFQWSIFIKALAESLAAKGYSLSDGATVPGTALANLQTVMANILTEADLITIFNNPKITGIISADGVNPSRGITPLTTSNSTQLATTAFVQAIAAALTTALSPIAAISFGGNAAVGSTLLVTLTDPPIGGWRIVRISYNVSIVSGTASTIAIQLNIVAYEGDTTSGPFTYSSAVLSNPAIGSSIQGVFVLRVPSSNYGNPFDQIFYSISYSSTGGTPFMEYSIVAERLT